MSILYLGGISVGNTMSFRRQRMSSTYSRIGQTDIGHNCGTDTEEARLWVGRPGTDFMVFATACRTAISASARRRVFTITDVRCQKGTWVWPLA